MVQQVVIVDQTKRIDPSLLHTAAMALNVQVTRDLPQCWAGISASVSFAPSLASLPHGAWPVFLVSHLPPGEGGFHQDRHNQPYAKVIASPNDDGWTIDASHEIIEMLVDPFGNRMHASQGIRIANGDVVDGTGVFNYLVEACDPCEANEYGYDINGIVVSDFITPHYYDAQAAANTLYSFRGHIERPRQMLPGGYISYVQPDGQWNQILWVDPSQGPQYRNAQIADGARSLRLAMHADMGEALDQAKHAQRRKKDALPAHVRSHVKAYHDARNAPGREEHLRNWYGLGKAE